MRTTVVRTPAPATNPVMRTVVKNVRELSVLPGLIIVAIVGAVVSPAFLSAANLTLILRQSAELGIVVIGLTFILITGKLDISLESTVGLAPMVAAWLMAAQKVVWQPPDKPLKSLGRDLCRQND